MIYLPEELGDYRKHVRKKENAYMGEQAAATEATRMKEPSVCEPSAAVVWLEEVRKTESLEYPVTRRSKKVLPQHLVETLPGLPHKLPNKFETGYIGVGENEEVQLFYYFFESESNPEEDPFLLWITGGPGCTFVIDYANLGGPITLKLNEYAWTKAANILFIDQPAGTEFSYAETLESFLTNDTSAKLVKTSLEREIMFGLLIYEQMISLLKKLLMFVRYIGVGENEEVQLFYFFFESESSPEEDPFILWLTGGPGCSGLSTILMEMGTFVLDYENCKGGPTALKLNEYAWAKAANILFIDQPVGTGYSYAKSLESFLTNDTLSARHTYDFLRKSAKINCHGNYRNIDSNNNLCLNDIEMINQCLGRIPKNYILDPWCEDPLAKKHDVLSWYMPSEENPINFLQSVDAGGKKEWCRVDNFRLAHIWANDKSAQNALNVREVY
ncbi:Serine carboxypeptidase-like 6 [Sesamum angolense]|uniref:Serine carboxypeptidase-like 6 n=1 Tax=Sesamum angolense TaxID=2727404 RepID=A0AAE1VZJ9_9LAMI|nr:Serine carboxypeptidase-like 6 [Sesamum angolense]